MSLSYDFILGFVAGAFFISVVVLARDLVVWWKKRRRT